MVVKERVGRRRYILFQPPEDQPSRGAFNQAIGGRAWKLTVYEPEAGILRVPHTEVEQAIEVLEELGARPVTTSGTIRGAKRRGGLLDR